MITKNFVIFTKTQSAGICQTKTSTESIALSFFFYRIGKPICRQMKEGVMMIFICCWKDPWWNRPHQGFVKAKDADEARKIMNKNLMAECELAQVDPADESWITPQSLTVNFPNLTDYELFG